MKILLGLLAILYIIAWLTSCTLPKKTQFSKNKCNVITKGYNAGHFSNCNTPTSKQ